MMMKRTVLFILFFMCSLATGAQIKTDSCTLEISLLTCAPGTDLYSIFGHTAIRVQDMRRGMDIVYNYGFFDDTDPLFYVHFTKGIMRYAVSAETFSNFMAEYQFEHRAVVAQVMNLTCKEKNQLYESLRTNTLDENRFYNYHFHTDNCTTRAGKIIESNTDEPLIYSNILLLNSFPGRQQGLSYRGMIHEYLDKENAYWPELGIDFLLGRNMDVYPTNTEAIHFLPDYLYRGMNSAKEGNKPMVLKRQTIISFPEIKTTTVWFTPLFVFSILLLGTVVLFLFRRKSGFAGTLLIFDIIFFSLLGLIGILITYLWIGRVDDVCRDNINILWALPTHIIAVFFIRKKAAWVKYYFLITAIIAMGLLAGFPFWSQLMNQAVIPILITIMFRGFILFKNRNHAEENSVQG
jgi:Domain of unknown function (DUF4105)